MGLQFLSEGTSSELLLCRMHSIVLTIASIVTNTTFDTDMAIIPVEDKRTTAPPQRHFRAPGATVAEPLLRFYTPLRQDMLFERFAHFESSFRPRRRVLRSWLLLRLLTPLRQVCVNTAIKSSFSAPFSGCRTSMAVSAAIRAAIASPRRRAAVDMSTTQRARLINTASFSTKRYHGVSSPIALRAVMKRFFHAFHAISLHQYHFLYH